MGTVFWNISAVTTSMILAFALTGCGGGGGNSDSTAPTAMTTPSSGNKLTLHETVVIQFSESMDTSSLALGGNMAADSDAGAWSTTTDTNDTLTISPGSHWKTGAGTLTVDAKDLAGNSLSTINLSYTETVKFTTFQNADLVIGQPDFISYQANQGGTKGANTINGPVGNPGYGNNMLYLPDSNNHRVLGFNTMPATNNANADLALGQTSFTSSDSGVADNRFVYMESLSVAGNQLLVDDYLSNRVLIYNSLPTSGPGTADHVVGQVDMTSSANACTATGLYRPESLTTINGKLIVTDSSNNRVLIWNSIPASDGVAADLVLGQGDFTHCTANDDDQNNSIDATPSGRTFNYPTDVWSDGTRLVVVDTSNNRLLIWNTFPTSDFQPADIVLGQSDFTHAAANDDDQNGSSDSTPSARTLDSPVVGLTSDGSKLIAVDENNHRVLIWNTFPSSNFQAADVVLGQGDFTHYAYNDDNQDGTGQIQPTARTLFYPSGLTLAGDKLIVTDNGNNRFLVFTSQ